MKVIIRTSAIVNCWNTKDACIIETSNGKKWVCEKTLIGDDRCEWDTITYIEQNQDQEFITFDLKQKGKRW